MPTIYKNSKKFASREMIEAVLEENRSLVQRLSDKAAQDFIRRILDAKSIFFSAQGRAGFILRFFLRTRKSRFYPSLFLYAPDASGLFRVFLW